ncbi:helix-turn-helix domain-containing protein [Haloferula rosea]|uniref:Helix-turn-helix domain-containing protein n=1 Tax=Haloferula rosea TaxID=490093 RepID=A0A934REW9_9BACT|nr:substrate-binding domain-containing protein [Haloferula rosea]MBK1827286.1 helix-turn-helix domain-containing protein [Haloferula rosea]
MRKETERMRAVALVLPMFFEYSQRVRQGVLDWVESHGQWHVIELDPEQGQLSGSLTDYLDGVILWHHRQTEPHLGLLESKLPVVQVGMPPRGNMSDFPGRSAQVTFDRRSLNDLALDHFQSLGVECVGYVGQDLRPGGVWATRVSDLREKVLQQGLEWISFDLGAQHPISDPTLIWQANRISGLNEFLEATPIGTGLLCQDDYIGIMTCTTARNRGIEIPGHLAVLGQGDRTIGRSGACSLSSVEIPGEEIGREASAMLDQWMSGSAPRPTGRLMKCRRLLVRESTGGLSGEPTIERAKRHFDRHHLTGVTVGELASLARCAPLTLRRRFRQAYGFEIAEEARRRRFAEARRLLGESDLEIQEIGERCGFSHPPNFFNFIHRQTGMGPSAYRASLREPTARS